ncbi:hypothetical protein SLS62_006529 [Diatrype stigma]|uniref:Uncharacterized protein n=1 Tax=Diatrype stigma TaxID=117547 RepID=A0AAN9YRI1_9PEZI
MAVTTGLGASARSLIQRAILNYDEKYGFGSMSSAIYDTAWVSLITKSGNSGKQWLFPQCFEYLLETQSDDGWSGGASQTDGILNTAASLLSLIKHSKEPLQITDVSQEELETRISTATASLQRQLHNWDVESSTHVGFEVIIPALLDMLEREDSDRLRLQFNGREELMRLNAAKLSKFKPEYLYGKVQLTVLHSLEAFIGKIDFDKIAHHVVGGSLMASPSSTAAYLMNASRWDDDAEAYLRHVVSVKGNEGGVPSAYPSTYFEYSWVRVTMI